MPNIRRAFAFFFEYNTAVILHIESKTVGIIGKILQILILGYIIGYVLIWKKGYQEFGPVASTSTLAKVKGVVFTNLPKNPNELRNKFTNFKAENNKNSKNLATNDDLFQRIFDPADYVVPSWGEENGGFFILTNIITTENQQRGVCPEASNIEEARCKADTDCKYGKVLTALGNGVQSGLCVSHKNGIKSCEIFAWCPAEEDFLPSNGKKAILEETKNFQVLIKNYIEFPKFGDKFTRRNILESANATYLQNCLYDPKTDPFCPIFKLDDIVRGAGERYEEVAIKGAVFEIEISWYCNLDLDFLTKCRPKYSFKRADNPNAKIAEGWNFRTANFHEENKRTLHKMYGLKFQIRVEGEAGKFSIVPLLVNIGSGLALIGITTLICDFIALTILKDRELYNSKKYLNVQGRDAFKVKKKSKSKDNPGISASDDEVLSENENLNSISLNAENRV